MICPLFATTYAVRADVYTVLAELVEASWPFDRLRANGGECLSQTDFLALIGFAPDFKVNAALLVGGRV
jgi:hypothetical protein